MVKFVIRNDAYSAVWMSIQLYSEYKVSESSMFNNRMLKAPQVVLRTGNVYGPIQLSTDAYWKILTEHELNCESSKMRREKILGVTEVNDRGTIPTHTEPYGCVLNCHCLRVVAVISNLLLPSTWAAAHHLLTMVHGSIFQCQGPYEVVKLPTIGVHFKQLIFHDRVQHFHSC